MSFGIKLVLEFLYSEFVDGEQVRERLQSAVIRSLCFPALGQLLVILIKISTN